jgi:hypothetical protein
MIIFSSPLCLDVFGREYRQCLSRRHRQPSVIASTEAASVGFVNELTVRGRRLKCL